MMHLVKGRGLNIGLNIGVGGGGEIFHNPPFPSGFRWGSGLTDIKNSQSRKGNPYFDAWDGKKKKETRDLIVICINLVLSKSGIKQINRINQV